MIEGSGLRPADLPRALDGFGIIYFGNSWQTENRTSSHHIATQLARRMPVVYLDSPGLRAPSVTGRDMKRLLRTVNKAAAKPMRLQNNLWHGILPQVPYRRVPGVPWMNHRIALWAAERAKDCVGCRDWITWFVVPHPGSLAGQLGERLCVYYCIDDYAAHPGVDREVVARLDAALTRKADIVFVAPPAIVDAKRSINANTIYSPHGVDSEHFARASDAGTGVPDQAKRLPHPVIGFFGLVADWIDLDLIAHMARARPSWTFLFVGHVYVDTSELDKLGNVAFVGAQPYENLPNWAKAFDVAIIPYRDTRQTRNANPLKLREYLATGRPVVATPNAEVLKFRNWVRIASTGPDFLAQVEAALDERSPAAAAARMDSVRHMTWNARVGAVLEAICSRMGERNASSRSGTG